MLLHTKPVLLLFCSVLVTVTRRIIVAAHLVYARHPRMPCPLNTYRPVHLLSRVPDPDVILVSLSPC